MCVHRERECRNENKYTYVDRTTKKGGVCLVKKREDARGREIYLSCTQPAPEDRWWIGPMKTVSYRQQYFTPTGGVVWYNK